MRVECVVVNYCGHDPARGFSTGRSMAWSVNSLEPMLDWIAVVMNGLSVLIVVNNNLT